MERLVTLLSVLCACGEVAEPAVVDAPADGRVEEVVAVPDSAGLDAEASDDATADGAPGDDAPAEPPDPIPLVDAASWSPAAPDEDPFAAARPEDATCAEGGVRTEAGTLEIDTGLCNWPTLVQPLLAPVAADATIEVVFWFGPTLGPEEGEAIVELRFAGEVIWHKVFTVPNTGGFVIETVAPPRAFAAGETALFHLHNHGANTWNLASVALVGSL